MTDRPTMLPPAWAESLLRIVLKPNNRDSVSGDLLEEYRESIVPALGAHADRWYVRQVVWYVLRATGPWAALVGGILVGRYLLDTLAPIHYTSGEIALRSAVMSWALIATCAMSGCWNAWRTGRLRAGVFGAFVTTALGGAISTIGTVMCLAVWHDPETWRAINGSGGIAEALYGVPLLLIPVGTIVGAAGAIAGRVAAAVYGASRPNTNNA